MKPSAGALRTIDGHDIEEIAEVLERRRSGRQAAGHHRQNLQGRGRFIFAGQGRLARQTVEQGGSRQGHRRTSAQREVRPRRRRFPRRTNCPRRTTPRPPSYPPISYKLGDKVATREAYGTALARIGEADQRIVAMDGDTKNSTFADKFFKKFPERSTECFIAEQNMVGVAIGFGARGKVPFASTFATFLHARLRPDPRRGHFAVEHQARRLARRREHRRGRPVANGAGRSGDDARDCRQHGAVSERRRQRGKIARTNGAGQGRLFPAHLAPENAGDLRQRRSISDRRRESAAPERGRQGHRRRRGRHAV